MQFDIVPEDSSADDEPIEYGLRAKLVAPSSDVERQRRIYICRHCPPPDATAQGTETAPTVTKEPIGSVEAASDKQSCTVWPDVPTEVGSTKKDELKCSSKKPAERVRQRKPKVLSFDGLRSHVKEK